MGLKYNIDATIVVRAVKNSKVTVTSTINDKLISLLGTNNNNVWSFPVTDYGDWDINIKIPYIISSTNEEGVVTTETRTTEINKLVTIDGNNNYYEILGVYETFSDNPWEVIIAASQDEKFNIPWNIGDQKTMHINASSDDTIPVTEGDYNVVIIGKDHDEYSGETYTYEIEGNNNEKFKFIELTTGTGKFAKLTFMLKEPIGKYPIHDVKSEGNSKLNWYNCSMNQKVLPYIKSLLPDVVKSNIMNVCKPTYLKTPSSVVIYSEDLFLLSTSELIGGGSNQGSRYEYFTAGNGFLVGWTRTHNGSDGEHFMYGRYSDSKNIYFEQGTADSTDDINCKSITCFAFCF